ncbi:SPFH domain-containing protein [Streptomyces sp. NPDC048213]|uniref:SPFH domain-containing protein n=1 Tax=Streptomyces sp. NPDC048213 TaxID=3160984 RepID=UPI0033F6F324
MRSTVDSSGNPEHGGETEYGTVPVREWVGPGGAGSVMDAWAARAAAEPDDPVAETRPPGRRARGTAGRDAVPAGAGDQVRGTGPVADAVPVADASVVWDAVPVADGLPVRDAVPGRDGGAGREAPPLFTPVSVSVPAGGDVVVDVPGPAEGERPEAGAPSESGTGRGAGPDSVVDLVLDLVPGEDDRRGPLGATSASVSVPSAAAAEGEAEAEAGTKGDAKADATEPVDAVPVNAVPMDAVPMDAVPVRVDSDTSVDPEPADAVPAPAPEREPVLAAVGPALVPGPDAGSRTDPGPRTEPGPRPDPLRDSGRHQAVIANERTASIPVHLLFREDRAGAAAVPATVVRPGGGEPGAGVRRPPVPRGPQVRPPTRPAPDADPRLHERPGPALPGWVALLTGLGGTAAAAGVLWWTGVVPTAVLHRFGLGPRPYDGLPTGAWAALVFLTALVLFALGGLTRGRVGHAWVLTLFGQYRGSVRRTGLMWISPLLLRRRVDVRLRHWRSEPLPAVDANGTALRVVVQVVWRVKDTVRAALGIEDHETYLREQVEAAMARVLSQLPADAFHEDAHTLRNAEAVGDALTRMLKADCEPVGVEVYSAQPTGIEYAPEVAAAMQRRRIAAIDAQHRDSVLTSVVDAVDDTVSRLTERGLVELDDYERKSLVKDLTVAFYTGRTGGDGA